MSKSTVSVRMPDKLLDYIDNVSENRTEFIIRACMQFIKKEDIIKAEIDRQKKQRDSLIDKKHSLDKDIESKRDHIRDLENMLTEIRALNKVRNEIPDEKIHMIRQTVRRNKYDNDPRSLSPEQVRKHNAQRLSSEYGLDEEKVLQLLEIETVG